MTAPCLSCSSALEFVRPYRLDTTHGPAVFGAVRLHRCLGCGLAQVAPLPGATDLAAYYSCDDRDRRRYGVHVANPAAFPSDNLFYLNRGRAITALVAPHVRAEAPSVLDVGAGFGHTLHALGERFPGARPVAVELSRPCIEHLRALGVEVLTGSVEETIRRCERRFDLVVLSHVLEHLLDPLGMLRRIRERLEPGGVLMVEVPNIPEDALRRYPDHVWNPRYDEPHITFFSRRTLRDLLAAAGFDVASCDTAGPTYRYVSALRFRLPTLRWWLQERVPPELFHWLRRQGFTRPLRMSDHDESFYCYGGDRLWLRSVSQVSAPDVVSSTPAPMSSPR